MTSATYCALPEGPPWPELIEGQLVEDPPPGAAHQDVQSNLFLLLASHVRTHGLGKVYVSPTGVWLSDLTVLEPDLVFLSTARRHRMDLHGIQGAPDLVIEILSPRSQRRDRHQKRRLYAAAGVPEYWMSAVGVNPPVKNAPKTRHFERV